MAFITASSLGKICHAESCTANASRRKIDSDAVRNPNQPDVVIDAGDADKRQDLLIRVPPLLPAGPRIQWSLHLDLCQAGLDADCDCHCLNSV